MGYILLAGGAEFGGRMAEPDREALRLAGGLEARVSIIPAAAAPDQNHQRAGRNGVEWFRSLGAQQVSALPLIDRASANDPAIAAAIRDSRLIYLLGGFPGYLGQTLADTASWQAILAASQAGAVIAGSSAGAMVLGQYFYDPKAEQIMAGLNLVPGICVLPHHHTFGRQWAPRLATLLPDCLLVGIDEQTAMLAAGPDSTWRVYGQGEVTLYRAGQAATYPTGSSFTLD
jgi:cyanophycinase